MEDEADVFEPLVALELEETDVFTGVLALATFAGGPLAEVNDAVNCCAIVLAEDELGVAEDAALVAVDGKTAGLFATTLAVTSDCTAAGELGAVSDLDSDPF